ncbi:MAG: protein-glutamate O-methyltransferase CheR [Vicinamibacteria bacterium]
MFHPSDHDVELTEEEFRLLRDFIHERFGLYYDDSQRASLRGRLVGRLQALDLSSFDEYYHHLRFAPRRGEELQSVVSHLTNNETYFFREMAQLNVFSDHVLRALRERKSRSSERRVRVLSVGCSTGEEPYSLAMLLYDSGQFFWGWDLKVTGIDVDHAALDKARRGLYFHNSFRQTPPAALEKHFVRKGPGHELKEPLRRMVELRQGNLLEPESYAGLRPVDVILCRNVLIYFSDAAIARAVGLFHSLLAPGGFLLLGHAESLARVSNEFTPVRFKGAMIYEKPEPAGAPAA